MFGKGASSSKSMEIIGSEKKFSVLIVDDDPIIRKIHSALLSKFTKEIQEVKNGKEAVDLCRSGASFDIIFMDKEMPIMTGLEVYMFFKVEPHIFHKIFFFEENFYKKI